MSKKILEKLDFLLEDINNVERSLLLRKQGKSEDLFRISEENESLKRQLKELQARNQKIENILTDNIRKLEQIIEKEEKRNV